MSKTNTLGEETETLHLMKCYTAVIQLYITMYIFFFFLSRSLERERQQPEASASKER